MGSSSQQQQRSALITTIASLSAVAAVGVAWYYQQQQQQQQRKPGESSPPPPPPPPSSSDTTTQDKEDLPVREIVTTTGSAEDDYDDDNKRILTSNRITIAHASVTGTCAKMAQELYTTLQKNLHGRDIQMGRMDEWDWWDELLNSEEDEEDEKSNAKKSNNNNNDTTADDLPPVLLLLIPTHHNGTWPTTGTCLETALEDLKNDWRIAKHPFKASKLQVAVLGMGCSDYGDDSMGKPAKQAFQTFRQLGAAVFGKNVRIGDDSVGNQDRVLQAWIHHDILPSLIVNDDDDEEEEDDEEPTVVDMEDMGASIERAVNDKDAETNNDGSVEPREMVTTTQAVALKKEGYKLIGTHSAVKLCRWTKHQLRGRGGCYKHTFYGITSYQCMEATPSLACANKCVFCWRHHKNPVAKEWKWKTDDPYFIVDEAVKMHVQMIKETKGIPGVNMERWKEAHTVRHCALSLVGEPIMYPRINELLADLHTRHISTYLVTNGQHPAAIDSLIPVTQLYVSVDAPTKESLIEIDRPLFSDAWDRLKQSLSSLKYRGQRTVARLTVVKGWNSDEIQGYAQLIALGKVSLVEIKGVTFCGKSDASNLNMSNSPWHHEVIELAKTLKDELAKLRQAGGDDAPPEYDIACEHKHSVSVLLARVDQFAEDDPKTGRRKWKTWIDYTKFQELSAKHVEDPSFKFAVEDYTAETPAWALFGSEEEGFDPVDIRHRRKQKYPKYTRFDDKGLPTHDDADEELSAEERQKLAALMKQKMQQVGCGSTVTELKGGERRIEDASLMFRGQTVVK
jgi:tRNA wybutosine-synthesizing protein 1